MTVDVEQTHQIFILEDHPLMRRVLRTTVEEEPDLAVAGEAGSAEDALVAPEMAGSDMVLVDLSLPGMSGLEFLRAMRGRIPRRLLVVSANIEPFYARAAFAAGASGYVSKDDLRGLAGAIRRVLGGERDVLLAPPRAPAEG